MSEIKEYVSVNEKDFGKKESLKLTDLGNKLDSTFKQAILGKIQSINKKLDADYAVSMFGDSGKIKIGENVKAKLVEQLKNVLKEFNVEIENKVAEYGKESVLYENQIKSDMAQFFDGKNLSFHNNSSIIEALISVKHQGGNANGEIVTNTLI